LKIFNKKSDLITCLSQHGVSDSRVGFVPTMGSLHEGHITLIKKSLRENTTTVVSIFINPTQFNSSKDLETYPKNLNNDCSLLKTISENILVFVPSVKEIYGNNMFTNSYDFNGLDKYMEGKFRNNHFDGVATVVELLFNIVKPTSAYFGEKDFQQLKIISTLNSNVKIISCKTHRDKAGLAFSSRNKKLNSETTQIASNIFKNLCYIKSNFKNQSIKSLKKTVVDDINSFDQMDLEYLIIADDDKLVPTNAINFKKKYRAFISVFVDGIRLIDNIALN